MAKVKVRVQVLTSWGKTCLREIRGLEEGTIKVGRYNERVNPTAVEIKHNGEDAVLWLGENCSFVKGKTFKFRVLTKYQRGEEVFETSKIVRVTAQDVDQALDKVKLKVNKTEEGTRLIDAQYTAII